MNWRRGFFRVWLVVTTDGGLRSTYNRTRPDYIRTHRPFRVRYWRLSELRRAFSGQIGPSCVTPAAFGGLGLLWDDWRIVSTKAKLLLLASATLKAIARVFRPLILVADSVYIVSTKVARPESGKEARA